MWWVKTGIGTTPLWKGEGILEYVEEQIAIPLWQQAIEEKHLSKPKAYHQTTKLI